MLLPEVPIILYLLKREYKNRKSIMYYVYLAISYRDIEWKLSIMVWCISDWTFVRIEDLRILLEHLEVDKDFRDTGILAGTTLLSVYSTVYLSKLLGLLSPVASGVIVGTPLAEVLKLQAANHIRQYFNLIESIEGGLSYDELNAKMETVMKELEKAQSSDLAPDKPKNSMVFPVLIRTGLRHNEDVKSDYLNVELDVSKKNFILKAKNENLEISWNLTDATNRPTIIESK